VTADGLDDGYEDARKVWNGMTDKRPGLIVQCADVADVMKAVAFARDNGLLVAVRGGAHSVAGHSVCDGGVLIDLSHMKSVRVDPAKRTARAEGGAKWGDFDHETQAFGLATTGGTNSDTGIGGLTLGGGLGWLAGKYGLTCDNLMSADVVTADGRLHTRPAQLTMRTCSGGYAEVVATSASLPRSSIDSTRLARCWVAWSFIRLREPGRSSSFTAPSRARSRMN
jgi:FAD/FMN-containing dehydrogenase